MKPGSIIFLIVSVLVIIAGLVLCTIGVNLAREQDVALFAADVSVIDGNVVRSDTFNAAEINKIKMNLDDVDVYIGLSETGEAYMELHNFQVGTYDYSIQNKMLLVDNETSIFSIMHIVEGNFSFEGLRHYLTYKTSTNTQKALYLYLTEDTTVTNFDIACTRGNVIIEGLTMTADYNVAVSAGDITLRGLVTKSMVNLSTNKGIVTMDYVSCRTGDVIIGVGAADLYLRNIPKELNVTVNEGDIECGYTTETAYGLRFVMDAGGSVALNGEAQEERPFTYENSPGAYPQNLTAINGNVAARVAATAVVGRFVALSEQLAEEAAVEEASAAVSDTETESVTDTDTVPAA